MREEKFHIYLNDDEYSRVIQTLIRLKNSLISQGRYTDGVDDVVVSSFMRKLVCSLLANEVKWQQRRPHRRSPGASYSCISCFPTGFRQHGVNERRPT